MNAPRHTPGPWEWNDTFHALRPVHPDAAFSDVHTILELEDAGGRGFVGSEIGATLAENAANYVLIKAAPELLEALQMVADCGVALPAPVAQAISAALQRATAAPVVIYGPPGCGKTSHAAALARFFGKTQIIDDDSWRPEHFTPDAALVLTQIEGIPGAIPFTVALERLHAA